MAVPFHCITSLMPTVSTHPPACSLCAAVKIPPNSHLPQQETPGLPTPPCSPGRGGSVQPCASHLPCTPGLVGNPFCRAPSLGTAWAHSPLAPPKCALGLVPVSTGASGGPHDLCTDKSTHIKSLTTAPIDYYESCL